MTLQRIKLIEQVVTTSPFHLLQKSKLCYIESLLAFLINLAMGAGLETLLMELVEDRDASLITSVKRLGFLETAALKDFSKDRAGNSHNLVIMAKRLHQFLDDIGGDSP